MVLVILAVLWILVLTPTLFKKFTERHSSESIDSFHHELHTLERAGPKLVAPAYRLETAQSTTGMAPGSSGLPSVSSMPGRPKLVLLPQLPAQSSSSSAAAYLSTGDGNAAGGSASATWQGAAPAQRPGPSPYQRRQVLKRRRDILLALLGTFVLTALLGFVGSLRELWVITLLTAVALTGYVVLINQVRRTEAERQMATRPRARRGVAGAGSVPAGYPEWAEQGQYAMDDYGYEAEAAYAPQRVAASR